MSELRVKTKLSTREVKKRFSALPNIIAGRVPDPLGLRPRFFAVFARRLYQLIYQAFKIKAAGGTDSLGNTWRGLKPRTIKKRLSPGFIAKYPLSARLLIHRVTDRLLESFKPGEVRNTYYIPSKEQTYLLQGMQLVLGSEVPYFSAVHKRRRIWPARMKLWIADATDKALDRTLIFLAKSLPA